MSSKIRHAGSLALALAAIVCAFAAAPASGHDVRWVKSARENVHTVTFKLRGVPVERLVDATVVARGARRKLTVDAVRRGARRGVLRLRRRVALSPRARRVARRAKLRLVIDTTAPDTQLTSAPSGTSGPDTTFAFVASERRARFQCRLDDRAWVACASPVELDGLADGSHTFAVRAVDAARHVDASPDKHAWSVTAPAVDPRAPVAEGGHVPAPAREPSVPQPVSSARLSDAEAAARVKRSDWEPRPQNAGANHRVPSASELAAYRAARGAGWCNGADLAVTGNFTGTTDEILQWSARKWGFDPDLLRAVAVTESWWKMSQLGDNGTSFGITQVKNIHAGTHPLSTQSTAFNADYYGAILRHYFDGCATWLNDVARGQQYAAGDLWGSVGAWFAGRWHTTDADRYIGKVKEHLAARTWASPSF